MTKGAEAGAHWHRVRHHDRERDEAAAKDARERRPRVCERRERRDCGEREPREQQQRGRERPPKVAAGRECRRNGGAARGAGKRARG